MTDQQIVGEILTRKPRLAHTDIRTRLGHECAQVRRRNLHDVAITREILVGEKSEEGAHAAWLDIFHEQHPGWCNR